MTLSTSIQIGSSKKPTNQIYIPEWHNGCDLTSREESTLVSSDVGAWRPSWLGGWSLRVHRTDIHTQWHRPINWMSKIVRQNFPTPLKSIVSEYLFRPISFESYFLRRGRDPVRDPRTPNSTLTRVSHVGRLQVVIFHSVSTLSRPGYLRVFRNRIFGLSRRERTIRVIILPMSPLTF